MSAGAEYDVTVVIPTRNGGKPLARALDALAGQQTARRFEILALDSGSTDGTLDRLAASAARVLHVPTQEFDWGRARDRLFEEARGAIVVSLSQDAIPARADWLDRLVAPLSDPAVGASSGSSVPDPDRETPQFQWERNGFFYFTREMKKFTGRYGRGLSFANTAVRREVWERLRIGPQPTGEDFRFQTKLHAAGLRIAFPDDAPVLHHHDYTLRMLYVRCRNEGLALRVLGCPYHELDLVRDLLDGRKNLQWLREIRYGRLRTPAEWAFPVLRPLAVYAGSRFGRRYVWY